MSVALSMHILYTAYLVACDQKARARAIGVHNGSAECALAQSHNTFFASLLDSIRSVLVGGDSHHRLDLVSIANVFALVVSLQVQLMC